MSRLQGKFDHLYDGGFGIAERIVEIFNDSKGFTLTDYESKEKFYEEYFTNYYTLKAEIMREYEENSEEYDNAVKNTKRVEDQLESLRKSGGLNYKHFLVAFMNLMTLGEYDADINSYPEFSGTLDNFIDFYRDRNHGTLIIRNTDVVPFCVPRGVFGINTFLYLFFNGISPVGISLNYYKVHCGMYSDPIQYLVHDLEHIAFYSNIYKDEYKPLYDEICKNTDLEKVKSYIFLLFFMIHESSVPLGILEPKEILSYFFNLNSESDFYCDMHGFIKNGKYRPEALGYSREEINKVISESKTGLYTSEIGNKYINDVITNIVEDLMRDYGEFIKELLE